VRGWSAKAAAGAGRRAPDVGGWGGRLARDASAGADPDRELAGKGGAAGLPALGGRVGEVHGGVRRDRRVRGCGGAVVVGGVALCGGPRARRVGGWEPLGGGVGWGGDRCAVEEDGGPPAGGWGCSDRPGGDVACWSGGAGRGGRGVGGGGWGGG